MTDSFTAPLPFITKQRAHTVPITLISEKAYDGWLKKQSESLRALAQQEDFSPGGKAALLIHDAKGHLKHVYATTKDKMVIADLAACVEALKARLSNDALEQTGFALNLSKLTDKEICLALAGWGLGGYQFDALKSKPKKLAAMLYLPEKSLYTRALAFCESIYLLRNLINTPANLLGPAQLEDAARHVAGKFKAKVAVISDEDLLKKNFPLIHAVGDAAGKTRRPRLIDLSWGNKKHPKLTLVGKGVCFDTGGLDLKPSAYMKLMKKDMGGAAHALGLAWLIMAHKLPVNLRVLIPAVENSVGGDAFRPGDIFKSRKGLFVENTNTDAEGRLVLADALTYACEDTPELVIDFATLTGSARAALGEDIPAMFSTNDKTAFSLRDTAMDVGDPLWQMPLWQPYKRHIEASTADLLNSASPPGDLIYSALFLQQFITEKQEWIHIDCFAWESAGRPGRAKGGTDTGLRAVFAYLEQRYGG